MTNNDGTDTARRGNVRGIQHREILEALSDAIHVVDQDMRIIFQNPAFSRWLGSLELNPNITGMKITEAFPFISGETLDEYRHVFSTGLVHLNSEETLIGGRKVFTEITKVPVVHDGSVEQIVTVIRDITEQSQSQRALEESEERYRLLYENLSDALFLTDITGRITLAGERAESIFGFVPEELVGMHFSDLIHPKMRDRLINAFKERLETQSDQPEGFEAVGIRKDGSHFTFHITNKVRYDGKRPIGYQSLIRDVSERKRAEQALQDERDRAQVYLDVAAVILVALDSEGNITLINQKGLELLGYEEEEIIGKNWFDLVIPQEDLNNTLDVFDRIMNGEIQHAETFENVIVTASGNKHLILWNNKYLRDDDGVIFGTLSSGQDISEIRRAEEELRDSEQQLKMVYDTILDGIIITDEKLNIISCNPAAEKILGYTLEELEGQSYGIIIDESMTVGPDAKAREKRLYEEGFLEQEDYYFVRKNGEVFPTSFSASLLRDKEGNFKGMLGSIRDTTEKKKTSEALRSEKEKYEILFGAAPIAIAVSREDGEILDVNRSMQEMLGYPTEELKEKSALEFYTSPEDREKIKTVLEKERKVRDAEIKMRRKDGKEIDVLQNVDYVQYEDNLARLSTMRDITELTKTKIELELARARAEFFNDLMAHDINNVHQGILVGAELLLRREDLSQEATRHSKAIRDQVSRGIQLIENVRKLSKMEVDEKLILQPLDLHGVIANAILLVQHGFPEKDIQIDIKFKPEEVIVLADEFLIDLFYNLIHNAMKFNMIDEGVIEIIVESGYSEGFVRIAIMDRGAGIPDDRKEELFSRLEKGRTLGSGMGLTLVKRITERYEGRAWVEDRVPGTHAMGAKFVIELPKKN
ncbi:MAG: PAS domain S-box protein [Candidatus Thorarchaeota archaeon]|nr:PAS domain S-box protein [Candidatus Thorarchaeota archaeon]